MTLEVHEDMIEGGSVGISLEGGTSVKRVFIVTGVEGNPHSIVHRAATTGQIPNTGDPHPSILTIRVSDIAAAMIPGNAATVKVTVSYKALKTGASPPDEEGETQITLSGTIQGVQTNKFIEKKKERLMIVKYTYPLGKAPDGVDNEKEAVITATKQVASIVANLSRQESDDALTKAAIFVGTLNSKKFLGTAAKTWLCTKISSTSNDSGETYSVNYEFQYNSDTWDIEAAFTDPETGLIPPDAEDQTNAIKRFQLQKVVDFGKLKLEGFQS